MEEIEKIEIGDLEGLKHSMNMDGSELRTKSSLKMHYEAQVSVMDRQLGGLEGVRLKLGLSQRKMAQLLLVDPSAWTRWNRPGVKAPGIVWRALQWYMIMQEKIPGLTPNYFLGSSPDVVKTETFREIRKESQAREILEQKLLEFDQKMGGFKSENEQLLGRVNDLEKKLRYWRAGTLVLIVTVIFSTFIWILWAQRGFF